MAPASLQRRAQAADPVRPKILVAQIIQDFQREIYAPATAPITEVVVNSYVGSKRTFYAASPEVPQAAFFLEAYSSGDAKQLLLSYFNIRPVVALPTQSPPPPPAEPGSLVFQVLDQMGESLLNYKMTGEARYKTAYDGLKAWMDRYVSSVNTQLAQQADALTAEANRYQTANTELAQTQRDFRRVQREGPEVENTYLTIKKQADQVPEPDQTSFYVKVGIATGLVVGAIVLSLL